MSEPFAKNLWDRLNNSVLVRFLLLFASGWAFVQLLAYFEAVIVIFSFAAIIAFLLSYPVRWLRRFLPHSASVSLVFLLSLVLIGGFTATVGLAILSQGQQLVLNSVPDFLNYLNSLVDQIENYLIKRNLQVNFNVFEERFQGQALAFIGNSIGNSIATSQILLDHLVKVILVEVVAFFMLMDGENLWDFIMKFFPQAFRRKLTVIIQRNFLGFFQGQLLLSLFYSVAVFISFLLLQVPLALVLAAIVGVFQMIPGIGSTLGITLICLIVLPQSAWLAIKVLITCLVIQQIKDNLLGPRVMQNSINVHPVLGFLALLVGYRLAGLLGIFLAIPLAGVVVSFLEIEDTRVPKPDPIELSDLQKPTER